MAKRNSVKIILLSLIGLQAFQLTEALTNDKKLSTIPTTDDTIGAHKNLNRAKRQFYQRDQYQPNSYQYQEPLIQIQTRFQDDTTTDTNKPWTANPVNGYQNTNQHQTNNGNGNHPTSWDRFLTDDATSNAGSAHIGSTVSDVVPKAILHLAHDIGVELGRTSKSPTQVFSPISIASLLSILFLGSNGNTFNEFMTLFGYDPYLAEQPEKIHTDFGRLMARLMTIPTSPEASLNKIELANGVFTAEGYSLRPSYKRFAEIVYRCSIMSFDFSRYEESARQFINKWAFEKTHGKIKNMISNPINPNAQMIAASSLYFLGFWEYTFPEKYVKEDLFYPNGIQRQGFPVQMMVNVATFLYYNAKEYDCQVVGLRYRGDEIRMYIILPNNSNQNKLQQMQQYLNADKINEMLSKVQDEQVMLSMPKMDIKNTIDLKEILQRRGLQTLFDPVQSNLTRMTDDSTSYVNSQTASRDKRLIFSRQRRQILPESRLYVSTILHKISLTVNEKGTEGGAVTYSEADRIIPATVNVNTPFMFIIRHESTKIPIFYGSIYQL